MTRGIGGIEILILPLVVRFEPGEGLSPLLLDNVAEAVVVIDVEDMDRVGLRQRLMASYDEEVLVIVVRCAIAEIVTAGYHDAVIRHRVDDHDFVVNDGVRIRTGLQQLVLSKSELVCYRTRWHHLDRRLAGAMDQRRIEHLCGFWIGRGAAHEQIGAVIGHRRGFVDDAR